MIETIRDALFQPIADALVRLFGIGPFAASRTLLRATNLVTPAIDLAKFITTGEAHAWLWTFDVIDFIGIALIALIPAEAAKRPPKPGQWTACELRSPRWTFFTGIILFAMLYDVVELAVETIASTSSIDDIGTTAALACDLGFMLGTCLWKDLPRQTRQDDAAPAPAAS